MVEPVRHRRTKGAATDMLEPKATASHLDSTLFGRDRRVGECLLLREERKSGLRGPISAFDPSATSDLIDALTMQSNDRVQLPLGACGEQVPTARQTLELMRTPLGEFQPRARYQVRYHP
jgi:hypothetical protein